MELEIGDQLRTARHLNGLTQKQVATALGISPKTVGRHIEHLYVKAGVTTRAGAALFAMEHGLLSR